MENTISGLPRLSGDYNRGYTQAIQDIQEIFRYIVPDLKHHHKSLNAKLSSELLQCILENRDKLRDQKFLLVKNQGFIRWNGSLNQFEYFSRSTNK